MTDEEFESEKMYCVAMALADRKRIITEELLAIIDTKLSEKYRRLCHYYHRKMLAIITNQSNYSKQGGIFIWQKNKILPFAVVI